MNQNEQSVADLSIPIYVETSEPSVRQQHGLPFLLRRIVTPNILEITFNDLFILEELNHRQLNSIRTHEKNCE